jgi:tripartite-type tricarboxylate transporter receptor subunit TctC
MFATDPQVVAVRAESKFKTFKELVEAGKRDPGTIPVGITGRPEPRASREFSS